MVQTVAHAQGPLKVLSNPILLDGERIAGRSCAPAGSDSEAILRALGFDSAAIAQLKAERVI
jgi:crotonobetainyl-CoA:carnitine CoA-transferase CaiB-like acyl-CoA transferase